MPYGYKKDPNDHNKLIIDEEAAEVVRELFRLSLSGALGDAFGAGIWSATGADFWNMIGQGVAMGFDIGAVTGAISGGIQGYNGWYQARALEFTHYGTSNEVVLGNYIQGSPTLMRWWQLAEDRLILVQAKQDGCKCNLCAELG